MNLTPSWVEYLAEDDVDAVHWSDVGDPRADHSLVMDHAREHQMIVFTHDLDFGSILAATRACGPSVIQARTEDPSPPRSAQSLSECLSSMQSTWSEEPLSRSSRSIFEYVFFRSFREIVDFRSAASGSAAHRAAFRPVERGASQPRGE